MSVVTSVGSFGRAMDEGSCMPGTSPGRVPNARFVYYLCVFQHLGAHGLWVKTSFMSKVLTFIIYT